MGRLLTTFKDKTFEPSMKSYYQLYTDDTSTAAQIYDSLLYVRGINAGSLAKNQEGDDDVSTVETYDTYMPIRFYNVKSKSDGTTPAGPTHTFFNVYNRAEYNGPDGQNMYDLWADYNIAKLSGASYITNTIGGAYNYGYDAGSGDDQTIPGVYGALNYTRIQPTGDNRTVTYAQGARNWIQVNKTNATVTYAYPTTSEFNLTDGNVGTLALHKFDLDYTAGNITNAYFIWADESSLPTPSGEKYFIKSNISWPTLLSGALTNTGAVTFGSTLSVSGTATLSSNVNIGGNLVVTGTSTFNGGTITIGDAASDNVVFGADVDSHIIPDDDNTYDLGSALQEWRDLYVDGTAYVDTISMGGNINLPDSTSTSIGRATFGDGQDLHIYHDGSNSYIENGSSNYNGNLIIRSKATSRDLVFQGDNGDGSSSSTTYFYINGSMADIGTGSVYTQFPDYSHLIFGNSSNANSLDLAIYHDGSGSYIQNGATNFNIESKNGIYIENKTADDINITNSADDGDIIFYSDNGSGGTAEYFRVDGGLVNTVVLKDFRFQDNVKAKFGSSNDFKIFHDGTDSVIQNDTGDLEIQNRQDDGDIIFKSDDGSGGVAEYFRLDGTNVRTLVSKTVNLIDGVQLQFGNSQDLKIYHNGNNSYIQDAGTGSLKILAQDFDVANAAESALMIRAIDGAQVELYYGGSKKLETTSTGVTVTGQATVSNGLEVTGGNANFADNGRARFGASADLQIYHDASNSFIDEAGTGDLYIRSSDNMYFQTYGSGKKWITLTEDAGVELFHNDSKKLETTSAGATVTGSLTVDDSIIHTGDTDTKIEFGDDSIDVTSGGTTAFDVVGGYTRFATSTRFVANATFDDNSKARFGTHNDLEIYHNGSNSFIDDNGAGSLFIRGDATIEIKSLAQDEHYIKCVENDTVELYHNGSKKFETTSTGTKTTGQINLAALNSAPSSASDTGTVGEIRFTSDYIYVCVASNTWKRAALSTW